MLRLWIIFYNYCYKFYNKDILYYLHKSTFFSYFEKNYLKAFLAVVLLYDILIS